MSIINSNLPTSWTTAKLGDVCEIMMGQSPTSDTYNFERVGLPFFQGKAEFTILHPITVKWCSKPIRIAEPNDILVSVRAPVGSSNIANQICCIGRGLAAIRYSPNYKFLFYFVRLIKKQLDELGTGTTFRAISGDVIRNTKIPIPPLPEQHRIVAKLEELFSQLDAAVSALKIAKMQIKTYKQSVLKHAFEGRLIEHNKPINEETGLPEGWKWEKLGDICLKIQDGSHFSPQEQFSEPSKNRFMYITAKNIRNNFMDFRKVTYVNEEFHKSIFSRCNPEFGDVLLTKDGINTGDVCINTLKEPISLLSSVCLIKPISEKVNSKFIVYFFQSNIGNRNLIGDMTGTAIKRIILKKIKETNIIIPPIKEQEQIVLEIETRFSEAENLEKTIDLSLIQAESLRQSILKKAFEGSLVPQDPNDEPAEQLLERIKKEKDKKFL